MSSSSLTSESKYYKRLSISPLDSIFNNSIHYIESIKKGKLSYEIATESNSNIKDFQISTSTFSIKENKSLIIQIKSLARQKLSNKYNCYLKKYNCFIINNILRNDNCHIVALFKDILINYSNIEFISKFYDINEIKESIKKSYIFYKNYFNFYCKPTFRWIPFSLLMKNYFDIKAKCFLNINNQANSLLEESSSNKKSNTIEKKTIESLSDSEIIFNYKVKEFLENITTLTNVPDNSVSNTINLNIDKEKLEIYRENKKDYSNNTTFEQIVNCMQNNNNNKINNKKENILKNELLGNKNNININLNLNLVNTKKNEIKKNIKKIPINILFKKLQIKNIKRNVLNNKIDYLLDNRKNKENYKYNNVLKNENLNIKNILIRNFNLKNNQKEKIKINKKNSKNISININNIINDTQNKENINNNNIQNFKNISQQNNIKKNSKDIKDKNNILFNNEMKLINQKILFKNKRKLSRNNILFYQTISSKNQISQYIQNSKYKKIKLLDYKYYTKNKSNNIIKKSNDNNSKSITSLVKHNHLRYKTKFIGNQEKLFKNLNSKIKKSIPKTYNCNTIQKNKGHNYNKSGLLSAINNNSNTNSKINIPRNNISLNSYLQKSINNSIYNDKSNKSLKTNEIIRIKNRIKGIRDFINKDNLYSDSHQNSINKTHNNNKSIPLLNKTYQNIKLLSNLNISNNCKKNYKKMRKIKNYTCIGKLNFIQKKSENINKKNNNNDRYNIKINPKIDINKNNFKIIKKSNTDNKNKNNNFKNLKLQTIVKNIKNEIKNIKNQQGKISYNSNKKYENKKYKNTSFKVKDNTKHSSSYLFNFMKYKTNNNNYSYNKSIFKNKDNKNIRIKKLEKRNTKINNSKITNKHNKLFINVNYYDKLDNIFHNKSQSTYGLDLNYKKFIKFKI